MSIKRKARFQYERGFFSGILQLIKIFWYLHNTYVNLN